METDRAGRNSRTALVWRPVAVARISKDADHALGGSVPKPAHNPQDRQQRTRRHGHRPRARRQCAQADAQPPTLHPYAQARGHGKETTWSNKYPHWSKHGWPCIVISSSLPPCVKRYSRAHAHRRIRQAQRAWGKRTLAAKVVGLAGGRPDASDIIRNGIEAATKYSTDTTRT